MSSIFPSANHVYSFIMIGGHYSNPSFEYKSLVPGCFTLVMVLSSPTSASYQTRSGADGGAKQMNKALGEQLDTVLEELNEAMWPERSA